MRYTRWYSRQRLTIIVAGCLTLLFLFNLRSYSSQPHLPKSTHKLPPEGFPPLPPSYPPNTDSILGSSSRFSVNGCAAYPPTSDVVLVVKTGATEISSKLPILLMTYLQCAPDDVLVFSDMEQMLGERRIYDALDEVMPKAMEDNPDFDLYKSQMEYRARGECVYSVPDSETPAWRLDKYKNLHTARKAWQLRPDKAWYFFVDADTYVFWSSLFPLLVRYDPDEKWYLGSRVNDGVPPFAHGGSGYLLSRGAMTELVGKDEKEVAERYDLEAVTACCGDQEMARTLSY